MAQPCAAEDIPSSVQIRSLLKDLREARQSKVSSGLQMINGNHLEMTNISSMEIAELRPFFTTAMKQLQSIQLQRAASDQSGAAPDTSGEDDTMTVRHATSASAELT
ncbi:DNA replication protein psf2 [Malassezia yamatoensis]|uniref:DNA replication complex GINS protein PSF2 n=1 Tax=Malassezia yamatoensis TaxID=253288 RepID=A0AAJ6CIN7_9BASI|nr:DNA replication protein psf2 [Malassezia yamatoensis]